MKRFVGSRKLGVLIEAEVAPKARGRFQKRYETATGLVVSPGNPPHYQDQPNKWGAELRVYFNDPGTAALLEASGFHVEDRSRGYKSGEYRYRISDNNLWWKLVEHGLRLGEN